MTQTSKKKSTVILLAKSLSSKVKTPGLKFSQLFTQYTRPEERLCTRHWAGWGEQSAGSAPSERLARAANLKLRGQGRKVGSREGALREHRGAGLVVSLSSWAPLHRLESPPLHGSPGLVIALPASHLCLLPGCSLGSMAPTECSGEQHSSGAQMPGP